jgi:hypothetical protein
LDTFLDTSCFILPSCYYSLAGQNERSMKGICRSPMLQPYARPTKWTAARETRQARKRQYLIKYEAMPEKQKREAYLMALMMIAEAVATLRSKRNSIGAEHSF